MPATVEQIATASCAWSECGNTFRQDAHRGGTPQLYCSRRCFRRARYAANADKERERCRVYMRTYRTMYPEKARDSVLRAIYGVGATEYDRLLLNQNGRCAICGTTEPSNWAKRKRFCIDHDHVTGVVRGLLCGRCNLLAASRHLETNLEAVVAYLRRRIGPNDA